MKRNNRLQPFKLSLNLLAIFILLVNITMAQEKKISYKKLSNAEERVIIHKGTETPFTGKYNSHKEKGVYSCKRCGLALYASDDKFDSQCGWPSFDDEIPGAVKRVTDADGRRTEIICNRCGAHLGHVFIGEQLTDKNVRHCVNSISLEFSPAHPPTTLQKAVFAGGCFWGVEYFFQKAEGVVDTKVGYTGGKESNPTYTAVSNHLTGHAEAIEVTFDPAKTSFEALAKLFFEIHDPTQVDRQGPDIGEQYRSAIYYQSEEQKKIAEKLITILKDKGLTVVTELEKAGPFWEGELYHQDYYKQNGKIPYCHAYQKKF